MVAKVNDNWDLTGQGIGNATHVLDASGAASVEDAVKELQLRHTVVGINGNFVAVQGDELPVAAGCVVLVSFPA